MTKGRSAGSGAHLQLRRRRSRSAASTLWSPNTVFNSTNWPDQKKFLAPLLDVVRKTATKVTATTTEPSGALSISNSEVPLLSLVSCFVTVVIGEPMVRRLEIWVGQAPPTPDVSVVSCYYKSGQNQHGPWDGASLHPQIAHADSGGNSTTEVKQSFACVRDRTSVNWTTWTRPHRHAERLASSPHRKRAPRGSPCLSCFLLVLVHTSTTRSYCDYVSIA